MATVRVDTLVDSAGTGPVNFSNSSTVPVVSKTTTYSATTSDEIILCSGSAFTVTLPAASNAGKVLRIIKTDSSTANVITIARAGSDTINGATSVTLTQQYQEAILKADGSTTWYKVSSGSKGPLITTYTSGSGTYTTGNGVSYLKVSMVGGGGGGGSSGTGSNNNGQAGGATTFGTTLLSAGGGSGGTGGSGGGGAGGSSSLGTGPVGIAVSGGTGQGSGSESSSGNWILMGGCGANSAFGGGGGGGQNNTGGNAGAANTGGGGGGGGASTVASIAAGAGGGAGGYVSAFIYNPGATYSYAVGSGGSGGSAGTSGTAGGAGGSGFIIVEEYYT